MWDKTLKAAATVFFASILCVSLGFAQEKTVEGTVTEAETGQPLPGANVSVQGTQTGTATNAQGGYELTVPGPDAVLVFNFVGFQSQEVQVGDQTVIDVALQEQVAELDEVIVTGYSQQRRQEITGSVSSVDVAKAKVGQQSSPQDLIRGRVSGVNIADNSGEPGSGVSINIRGTSSITAGSDPLYVVDGVPITSTNVTPGGASAGGVTSSNSSNPLALINSQNIESIQVLKDASATSIYGSQGANGVIVIETSGGQAGTQVNYTGKVSASTFPNKLDLVGGNTFRRAQSCANDTGDFDSIDKCIDQREGDFSGPSTDWQDEATETAFLTDHNLSLSGGGESTTYRASVNYAQQNGLISNNGIERVTGRVNVDHRLFDERLRLGLNLTASNLERNHAFFNQGGGFEGGVIKGMIGMNPTLPVVNQSTGEFNEFSSSIKNPVALNKRITDVTDERKIAGNFRIEGDVLENLTAKTTLGVDISNGQRRTGIPGSGPALWVGQQSNGSALQAERELSNIVAQATLEYDKDLLENQSLNAIGGFEYERETWQTTRTETEDFITDATLFNNLSGGANVLTPNSTKQLVEQVGFLGRVNYNIDDRYLLTGTFRRDGSSVFGENQKFAWFPSGSVGWNMANEAFMEDVPVSQLKLRVGYGFTGNQGVPPLQSKPVLAPDAGFRGVFGSGENIQTGVAQRRAPNPNLKWEETEEVTVAVDFTAGRFDGSLEFYQKTTDDLLLFVPVPPPSVSTERLGNVGEVDNQGVEFSLDALVLNRDNMSLNISGNISSNKNEVQSLGGRDFIDHTPVNGAGQTGVDAQRLEPGHPIGSFFGPVFKGINEQGQETYKTEGGGTTTNLGEAVREHIGNPIPDFQYGLQFDFTYQNFDVSAFFRGEQNREIFNNTALEFATKSNLGRGIGVLDKALNDGTNSSHVPVYSSRWVQDASYFRMDNFTLGYNFQDLSALGIRRLRVFGTVQNVFVITPYDGIDPEVNTNVTGSGLGFRNIARPTRGVDYTSYPRPRTFTGGIELGF